MDSSTSLGSFKRCKNHSAAYLSKLDLSQSATFFKLYCGGMIWIALIDGSQMRVYAQDKPHGAISDAMGGVLLNLNPPSHIQGDDNPGRSFASASSTQHHSMTPRKDPHRQGKTEFAKVAIDMLGKAHAAHEFASLVIIAPPKILGDIRKLMPPALEKSLIGDLAKDLLKLPALERTAAMAKIHYHRVIPDQYFEA
jgi:protein required for attachment to host cells